MKLALFRAILAAICCALAIQLPRLPAQIELMAACRTGEIARVRRALCMGASPNDFLVVPDLKDFVGNRTVEPDHVLFAANAYTLAIAKADAPMLRQLLQQTESHELAFTNAFGQGLPSIACGSGAGWREHQLLDHWGALDMDRDSRDALIHALLNDDRVDFNELDMFGRTPLMYAAMNGIGDDLLEAVVRSGADPLVQDPSGRTYKELRPINSGTELIR